MNLKSLSDDVLWNNTKTLAAKEREITLEFLYHLIEIDRRKLAIARGSSRLHHYCTKVLKQSDDQASKRVNAARLLRDFPQIGEPLKNGELCLTTVSYAASFFKRESKGGKPISKENKIGILNSLHSKSTREAQLLLLKNSGLPPEEVKESMKQISEATTKIIFGANQELMANINRIKQLTGDESFTEIVKRLSDHWLKQNDPLQKKAPKPTKKPKTRNRHIPVHIDHAVHTRDQGQCTHINPEGERCTSKYRVQSDHIIPYARGGEHSLENLRLRCPAHNQLHARDCFGKEHMAQFTDKRAAALDSFE